MLSMLNSEIFGGYGVLSAAALAGPSPKRRQSALLEVTDALRLQSQLLANRLSALSLSHPDAESEANHALLVRGQVAHHGLEPLFQLSVGGRGKRVVALWIAQAFDGVVDQELALARPSTQHPAQATSDPYAREAREVVLIAARESVYGTCQR
jgi:hypothetical protein